MKAAGDLADRTQDAVVKALTRGWLTVSGTLIAGAVLAVAMSLGAASVALIILISVVTSAIQIFLIIRWTKSLDQYKSRAIKLLNKTGSPSALTDPVFSSDLVSVLEQTEKAVIETLRKERAAVENAVDVICVIDTDGNILSANQAANRLWGYSHDELIGHKITEFILAENAAETLNPFLGADKSIEKIFVENRFRTKGGELIDLLWSAHWSASDSGLFCVAHDITERKRNEKLLSESERRVRLILESMPAGIAIINKHGYFEFMNKAAIELTQFDESSLNGLRAEEVFLSVKVPFRIRSFIDSAIDQITIVNRAGKHIPCELSVKEFDWNDSTSALVIFLDLSDKFAAQQAMREFIAMVSHDLRGPLTSIHSVLNLVCQGHLGELSEAGVRLTNKINKESIRLIQMTSELLDIERMKSGRFVANLSETAVQDLISGAIEVVERSAQLQGLSISVSGDSCLCVCDGARIIQVLVNLLDNAIKYSQPGQEVRILVQKQESGGCYVSVCNNGRNIPASKLVSIFECFEQVTPSSVNERKGTGLGLAICKSIVEQHGEKIWAESTPEIGTRFSFSLGTKELAVSNDVICVEEFEGTIPAG